MDFDTEEINEANEGSKTVADYENEIVSLKKYINNNYMLYLKRLDKRKEQIRLIESKNKYLTEQNETLSKECNSLKEVQKHMSVRLEAEEDLKNFQRQEISKIKHMLLLTEKKLESECEKNAITLSSERDAFQVERDNYERQLADIKNLHDESSMNSENINTHNLDKSVGTATELVSLSTQLDTITHERDMLKSSLLECEIALHEAKTDSKLVWDDHLAKTVAEKETLQVALDLRETARKKQMEEHAHEVERLISKIRDLENSKDELRVWASELNSTHQMNMSENAREMEAITNQNQVLNENLSKAYSSLSMLSSQNENLTEQITHQVELLKSSKEDNDKSVTMCTSLRAQCDELKLENEKLNAYFLKMEDLEEIIKNLKKELVELKKENSNREGKIQQMANEMAEYKKELPQHIEKSDLVQQLRADIFQSNEQLEDSKKTIRVQRQCNQDMRKMLQKELKISTMEGIGNEIERLVPETEAETKTTSPALLLLSPSHIENGASDNILINFQYLKHVILKFFTSREYEASQMTRAISELLHFSVEEERLLCQTLEWKMSWFGSKPKDVGKGQYSRSIVYK